MLCVGPEARTTAGGWQVFRVRLTFTVRESGPLSREVDRLWLSHCSHTCDVLSRDSVTILQRCCLGADCGGRNEDSMTPFDGTPRPLA